MNRRDLLIQTRAQRARELHAGICEVTKGERLDGYEHLYVNDPYGNRLELLQSVNE